MQILMNLVLIVQMLSALTMIGLVLIQHGKGADMGASFGSGASGSLFGATGSANFLSRTTAVAATLFFACTLGMAYFGSHTMASGEPSSILDKAAPAASAPGVAASALNPAVPTGIPGALPAAAVPAPAASK
ncbi:MAG: preprotein translocase subunit SecG [Burkholderiaceae bacterium]|nr:preprotein translocase subunit SecG [Burkholderiaceae bacterium]MBT9501194.1 preprotein translocase subunit SecG [Burkholderiaceae bacterium]